MSTKACMMGRLKMDTLLYSIAWVDDEGSDRFRNPPQDVEGAKHRFNHLPLNPSGTRLIFLERRRQDEDGADAKAA